MEIATSVTAVASLIEAESKTLTRM